MKIKTLTWTEFTGVYSVFMHQDDIPHILLKIRATWDNEKEEVTHAVIFYHGWDDEELFTGTVDECKAYAQEYFEKYIMESYFQ